MIATKKVTSLFLLCFIFSCDQNDEAVSAADLLGQMQSIDSEIKTFLRTSCNDSDQCLATAYGVKACGGPATYLVHSSNMDLDRLNSLVTQFNILNQEYNEVTGAVSDCSVETAPVLECASGNCQVVSD